MDKDFESEDDAGFDLELRKLKLQAEYGINIMAADDLPAHLEHQCLDRLESIRKKQLSSRKVTIREYLGFPEITPLVLLDEGTVADTLKQLLTQLNENGIYVNAMFEQDAESFYRFVSEELMEKEVFDIKLPGMKYCFTYETYHPTDKSSIISVVDDFFHGLFDHRGLKGTSKLMAAEWLSENGEYLTRREVFHRLKKQCSRYKDLKIDKWELSEFELNEPMQTAEVRIKTRYELTTRADNETLSFSGVLRFDLEKSEDKWLITSASIPGMMV